MEQISIFDWMPSACPSRFPTIIAELSNDVRRIIKGTGYDEEEYSVWEHVPNLGKRYCVFVRNVTDVDYYLLEQMTEKYKKHNLEISVNVTPSMKDGPLDYKHNNFMISSLWTTKGHKENE